MQAIAIAIAIATATATATAIAIAIAIAIAKSVKQEVNGTLILPPLVFPDPPLLQSNLELF